MILPVYTVMGEGLGSYGVVWGLLGCFNGLHQGYANSSVKIIFANEFASCYRQPYRFTEFCFAL